MATKPRMIFRDVDGAPVPISPLDRHGTPITPDGVNTLTIEDAMERFAAERLALALLYLRVMAPSLGADVVADMVQREGGEPPK